MIPVKGAQYHEKSFGIEINRWLVYYAALKAKMQGTKNVSYFRGDMWKHDFDRYERAFDMYTGVVCLVADFFWNNFCH